MPPDVLASGISHQCGNWVLVVRLIVGQLVWVSIASTEFLVPSHRNTNRRCMTKQLQCRHILVVRTITSLKIWLIRPSTGSIVSACRHQENRSFVICQRRLCMHRITRHVNGSTNLLGNLMQVGTRYGPRFSNVRLSWALFRPTPN